MFRPQYTRFAAARRIVVMTEGFNKFLQGRRDRFRQNVENALRVLLQEKHLYQSVTVEAPGDVPKSTNALLEPSGLFVPTSEAVERQKRNS